MSWLWQMKDGDKWITNAVRFATKEEADLYGADLGMRWLAMPEPARSAESDDPVNYKIEDGKLIALEKV
jgi:hypothetical protein